MDDMIIVDGIVQFDLNLNKQNLIVIVNEKNLYETEMLNYEMSRFVILFQLLFYNLIQ